MARLVGGGVRAAEATDSRGFSDVADLYLLDCERRMLRPQSLSAYRNNVSHAKRWFANVPIASITTAQIVEYGIAQLEAGQSPQHARKLRGMVSTILTYAAGIGLVENALSVPRWNMPQDAREQPVRIIDRDVAEAIIAACPEKAQAGLSLMLWTGMRVGELLALTPKSLNLKDETLTISETIQIQTGARNAPKSMRSRRDIKLANDSLDIAREIRLPVPTTYWTLRKWWRDAADGLGQPTTRIHDLRHLNVSMRLASGQSLAFVAEQVGDTEETVMKTYAHVIPRDRDAEAAKLKRGHDEPPEAETE